jgi:hypothetical protein
MSRYEGIYTIDGLMQNVKTRIVFAKMKLTNYFLQTRQRPDRKDIKMEWIKQVCNNPEFKQVQTDGRIRIWAYIAEAKKLYAL